jgi:hypothetical protein
MPRTITGWLHSVPRLGTEPPEPLVALGTRSNGMLAPSCPLSASWRPWLYGENLRPPLPAAARSMLRKLLPVS